MGLHLALVVQAEAVMLLLGQDNLEEQILEEAVPVVIMMVLAQLVVLEDLE